MKKTSPIPPFLLTAFVVNCLCGSAQSDPGWKVVGQLKTLNAKDIPGSTWSIGGETLDRNYTTISPTRNISAPWVQSEFACRAVGHDAKRQRDNTILPGWIPSFLMRRIGAWRLGVELSYGNPVYEGGGEAKLAGHIPASQEALTAWDAWVKAMVNRYKKYVPEWEIWNEPDLNKEHTGKEIGEFYLRTAKLVRSVQPDAKLIALGMASVTRLDFVKDFMDYLQANNGLRYLQTFTYHGYAYNPDESYPKIEAMRQLVWKYKPDVILCRVKTAHRPHQRPSPSAPCVITTGVN